MMMGRPDAVNPNFPAGAHTYPWRGKCQGEFAEFLHVSLRLCTR